MPSALLTLPVPNPPAGSDLSFVPSNTDKVRLLAVTATLTTAVTAAVRVPGFSLATEQGQIYYESDTGTTQNPSSAVVYNWARGGGGLIVPSGLGAPISQSAVTTSPTAGNNLVGTTPGAGTYTVQATVALQGSSVALDWTNFQLKVGATVIGGMMAPGSGPAATYTFNGLVVPAATAITITAPSTGTVGVSYLVALVVDATIGEDFHVGIPFPEIPLAAGDVFSTVTPGLRPLDQWSAIVWRGVVGDWWEDEERWAAVRAEWANAENA